MGSFLETYNDFTVEFYNAKVLYTHISENLAKLLLWDSPIKRTLQFEGQKFCFRKKKNSICISDYR